MDYTPVKYVKQPSGAKPGMVVYTTYQTITVTPEEALVKRLRVKGCPAKDRKNKKSLGRLPEKEAVRGFFSETFIEHPGGPAASWEGSAS